MSKEDEELMAMLDYIDRAVRYANGGPYVDEDYKKQCLTFLENLYDSVLP